MLQELSDIETRILQNRLDREQEQVAYFVQETRRCGTEYETIHRAMELLRDGICKDIAESFKVALIENKL